MCIRRHHINQHGIPFSILIHLLRIQRHFHAALGREPRAEPDIGEAQEPGFSKWLRPKNIIHEKMERSHIFSCFRWLVFSISQFKSIFFLKQHFLNIDYPHQSSLRKPSPPSIVSTIVSSNNRWPTKLGRATAGAHPSWGAGSWQIQGDLHWLPAAIVKFEWGILPKIIKYI